jgi:hypothetical protein
VLEPVGHQQRIAVGGFDQVLQGVELAVMDMGDLAVVAVDSAVGKLGEFAAEDRGVLRVNGENLGGFPPGLPPVLC